MGPDWGSKGLTDETTTGSRRRRLSIEEWTALLADRYFPERAIPGPVHLAVDDDALDEIAGTDRGEGAAALAAAVRPSLRVQDPRLLFDDITATGYRWAGNRYPGPPPFLPCLALCVLAASRMDASVAISSTNYYVRLQKALGIDVSAAVGYPDAVPALFRLLREWLNAQRGRRGLSTIPDTASPAHIGFALSQIHVRESDRRKLTRFFTLLALSPTDAASANELVGALRRWAPRSDLSAGAKAFIASDANREGVAALIASELREWDETERDEHGRRLGRIQLLLEIKGAATWGVLVTKPEGFPPAAAFSSTDGLTLDLRSTVEGFYDPVWFGGSDSKLLARAFGGVMLLRSGQVGLRFAIDEVTALGADPRTGRLATVHRVEPGERHWILVHANQRAAVLELLEKIAREGWSEAAGAPDGWLLLRDIIVDMPPAYVVPESLAALVPAVDARPELHGGLPVGRMSKIPTYLRGGEPDLWIPEWLATSPGMRIRLDGEEVGSSGATRLQMSQIASVAGVHLIEVGGAKLRFRSIERVLTSPPSTAEACRIVVRPATGDSFSVSADAGLEGHWVCGAIASPDPDTSNKGQVPVLVPYGARRYVVVGSRIGEVAECRAPNMPGWLEEIGVLPQDFEIYPAFGAAWMLMEWPYRGWQVRELAPTPPAEGEGTAERDIEWAKALDIEARLETPDSEKAWDGYRARARAILDDGAP